MAEDDPLPTLALMPDVNLFLQCRSVASLAWTDLGEAGPITVYVGPTLQREIDRLKGDGSQRRAKRARDANSLFKTLLRAPRTAMVIQEANPRVTMTFLPHLDPQRTKSPLLDLSKPDDCHIEEALAFRGAHPNVRTAILTHDTGPMLTARHVGLEYFEVPDNWLLEPEKDDKQKQIEELKRQVNILQKQFPKLSVCAEDDQGVVVEAYTLSVVEYDAPAPMLVQSVITDLRGRHPLQEKFDEPPPSELWSVLSAAAGYSRKYEPPDQEEIEKYRRAYEAWLKAAKAFLEALPQHLSRESAVIKGGFRLENTGTESARSVLLEISATPGFLIRPPPRESGVVRLKLPAMQFPEAPDPPHGKYTDLLGTFANLGILGAGARSFADHGASAMSSAAFFIPPGPPDHDPNAFYYRNHRPRDFVDCMSLTCVHFRHKLEPEHFELEILSEAEKHRGTGAIRCRVSADNLPEPVEHVVPITVMFRKGDTSTEIERYRPVQSEMSIIRKIPRKPGGSGQSA